ncbi:MAG: AGE family epimerase/isomerase [Rhodobacteraceae bacterium]|nr:AGE family epimerase/isomerase [Paracoccaceae bacterium]
MIIDRHECPPSLLRLSELFTDRILPYWITVGLDPGTGHFHEALALDGAPLSDSTLRTRTAARMIYVYADAARLGMAPDGSLSAAVLAAEALERDAGVAEGGYVRSIDRCTGTVLDAVRDLYDMSCTLIALASLLQTTGERCWLERAEALLAALDRLLVLPSGGYAEDETGTLPRRQNPHMHLFEALTGLTEATRSDDHLSRLTVMHDLFLTRLLDGEGILTEYFGPAWERGDEWRSERLDPGHMAEWATLLSQAEHLLNTDDSVIVEKLTQDAIQLGPAGSHPLFFADEVNREGQGLRNRSRLWLQVEQIKSCLITGRLKRAEMVAEALLETYLASAERGVWIDSLDLGGNPIANTVPASSCYHLWTLVRLLPR